MKGRQRIGDIPSCTLAEEETSAMEAVAAESNVSPADKPDEKSVNRRRLEQIDADITNVLKTMVKSEDRDIQLSSEIVCAGVQMLAIRESDFDAWEAFKRADKQAKEIRCKGKGAEFREVATVLWRRHRAETPSRERIALYGKAIRIAKESYCAEGLPEPKELLRKVLNARGVKGLIKLGKAKKGDTGRKKITMPIPDVLKLIVICPDGSHEEVSAEVAKPVLIQMGLLQ
jgi:hypothetical protein